MLNVVRRSRCETSDLGVVIGNGGGTFLFFCKVLVRVSCLLFAVVTVFCLRHLLVGNLFICKFAAVAWPRELARLRDAPWTEGDMPWKEHCCYNDRRLIIAMTDDYEDIMDLPHPEPKRHKRMSMQKRAAQFRPFIPLKGYDEALRQAERNVEERVRKRNELVYDP